MKEKSAKNILDEISIYNEQMLATMGEAYRAYEKFSLMYSADENPFHGFHTQSEFFMNASCISAEDSSVIFNECKKFMIRLMTHNIVDMLLTLSIKNSWVWEKNILSVVV